ncbi:hypothetical protein IJ670_05670 [bacterium]|nr:hypothetical protein [bacterium]
MPKQNTTVLEKKPVSNNNVKLKAAIGATIGTLIPLGLMMKKRNTGNPLKLEYSLKDILMLSATSVAGGTLGGMIGENNKSKMNKFKEGTFQFLNAALPTLGVAGGLKLCAKQQALNHIPFKILSTLIGIMAGMFGAIKLSNFMFDPKDKHPDRKLSPKDYLASADEAVGALALTKLPIIKVIQLDKALPLIYGYCGYRAGKTN